MKEIIFIVRDGDITISAGGLQNQLCDGICQWAIVSEWMKKMGIMPLWKLLFQLLEVWVWFYAT